MISAGLFPYFIIWVGCAAVYLHFFWPWDWKGNRKAITIKRKKNPWEK